MDGEEKKPDSCPYRSRCGYWEDGKCCRMYPVGNRICAEVYTEAYLKGWAEAVQAVKEGREIVL